MGGSPEVVTRDIQKLFSALKSMGLEVNTSKCEFFGCGLGSMRVLPHFETLIPGLRVVNRADLCLLGTPIFREGVGANLRDKICFLASLRDHLSKLPAHVSLTLLKGCLAVPKVT